MSVKYGTYSRRCAAARGPERGSRAMTLVGVVGALALLGVLLVGTPLAKARSTRQAALADRRVEAVAAVDALLTAWRRDPQSLARSGGGRISGDAGLSWRTRTVPDAAVQELGAAVVRLEILD